MSTAIAAQLEGNYLYVASGSDGLSVLDLTNPQAPVKIGEYVESEWVHAIAVTSSLIVLGAAGGQVLILDNANPSAPTLLGQVQIAGDVTQVLLNQNLLIVLEQQTGVSLWDFSTPTSPASLSSFSTGGWSTDLALRNDTLLVADWFDGVGIFNISNPTRPLSITSFMPNGLPEAMDLQGDFLALADGDQGVELWIVGAFIYPELQSQAIIPGSAQDAIFTDGYIYEAAGDAGLRVWNANLQPAEPIAQLQTPGWANSIELSQSWIYLSDGFGGLRIFDRSSPPAEAFAIATEEYAGALSINGNSAVYVAQGDSGVFSLKLEGLASPLEYGYTPTAHYVYDLAAGNDFLIACEGGEGFEIFDIANPESPQVMAQVQPEGGAWCVAVTGTTAYVGTGQSGIGVFDLSTPQNPVFLGSTQNVGWVQSLNFNGFETLVASSGADGVFALNTSQIPPVVYDAFDTPGSAIAVEFVGTSVVCADEMDLCLLGGVSGLAPVASIPTSYSLLHAYPNPFNPATRISFSLPVPSDVNLGVYDLAGRLVASLLSGRLAAGDHAAAWQPDPNLASGTYFMRLKTDSQQSVYPLVYLK